jgi:hypothetical protein
LYEALSSRKFVSVFEIAGMYGGATRRCWIRSVGEAIDHGVLLFARAANSAGQAEVVGDIPGGLREQRIAARVQVLVGLRVAVDELRAVEPDAGVGAILREQLVVLRLVEIVQARDVLDLLVAWRGPADFLAVLLVVDLLGCIGDGTQ